MNKDLFYKKFEKEVRRQGHDGDGTNLILSFSTLKQRPMCLHG